jgi:hypothetical protein
MFFNALNPVQDDAIEQPIFAEDFKTRIRRACHGTTQSCAACASCERFTVVQARLRLALHQHHTKRTIVASSFGGRSSTATCAFESESFKDGLL